MRARDYCERIELQRTLRERRGEVRSLRLQMQTNTNITITDIIFTIITGITIVISLSSYTMNEIT